MADFILIGAGLWVALLLGIVLGWRMHRFAVARAEAAERRRTQLARDLAAEYTEAPGKAATTVELATWMTSHVDRGRHGELVVIHIEEGLPDDVAELLEGYELAVRGHSWHGWKGEGFTLLTVEAVPLKVWLETPVATY